MSLKKLKHDLPKTYYILFLKNSIRSYSSLLKILQINRRTNRTCEIDNMFVWDVSPEGDIFWRTIQSYLVNGIPVTEKNIPKDYKKLKLYAQRLNEF